MNRQPTNQQKVNSARSVGWHLIATAVLGIAMMFAVTAAIAAGEEDETKSLQDLRIKVPDFKAYEVEYRSGMGKYVSQVRPTKVNGAPTISVLNIIDSPSGVIVDSRGIDRQTLRLTYMMSPYFAWGQEYVVAQFGADGYDWLRIPLGGGEPTRLTGASDHGPFVDELGFSPTFAALLPLPKGTRFTLPMVQPRKDGSVSSSLVKFEVVGQETLSLKSGLDCECHVLEQTSASGSVTRYWVSREAPFVFRRHRDIGGPREMVTDALSLRTL